MIELAALIIVIIIVSIGFYYQSMFTPIAEPFESLTIRSCPSGYGSFYAPNGTASCCEGNRFIGGQCESNNVCTIGSGPNSCAEMIMKQFMKKGHEFCPPSMPSYFEDLSVPRKGCVNGPRNEYFTGPMNESQPQCMIYNTEKENILSETSCLNEKELEEYNFGYECKKSIVKMENNMPPLLMITFTDSSGWPRSAYTMRSAIRYLDMREPGWKNKFNINRSIQIAEVAKEYFLDRTLSSSDVDL